MTDILESIRRIMVPIHKEGYPFIALAAVLMLGAFVLPLWRIDLEAPQYPEGIGMLVRVNTVEGVKDNDLQNINGLNHYIGMPPVEAPALETALFPIGLGVVVGSALVAALAEAEGTEDAASRATAFLKPLRQALDS